MKASIAIIVVLALMTYVHYVLFSTRSALHPLELNGTKIYGHTEKLLTPNNSDSITLLYSYIVEDRLYNGKGTVPRSQWKSSYEERNMLPIFHDNTDHSISIPQQHMNYTFLLIAVLILDFVVVNAIAYYVMRRR